MTKKELIANIASETGLTQVDTSVVLDSFLRNITRALITSNCKIMLPGFGTFERVYRKARKCRNPRTGEEMEVSAKNVVKFRPGKQLREIVSKN